MTVSRRLKYFSKIYLKYIRRIYLYLLLVLSGVFSRGNSSVWKRVIGLFLWKKRNLSQNREKYSYTLWSILQIDWVQRGKLRVFLKGGGLWARYFVSQQEITLQVIATPSQILSSIPLGLRINANNQWQKHTFYFHGNFD